ncbi:MAG TPA: hypothetical protein VJC15_03020 [Candidatus Paceibacterota bacterium]
MKKIGSFFFLLLFLLGAGISVSVLAAEEPPEGFKGGPVQTVKTGGELVTLIQELTNWVFVVFLLMAVIFVILAAFQFLSGGGDPQAVAQARQKLIWAAVGIIVATLARAIPTVVNNIINKV